MHYPANDRQRGFTIVEILLAVVLVGLILLVSYQAYQAQQKMAAQEAAQKTALKQLPTPTPTPSPKDPVEGWKAYESAAGKFSFKTPDTWSTLVCEPNPDSFTVYVGPTQASSGACGTQKSPQIIVMTTPAVPTVSEQSLGDEYFESKTTEDVVVEGVKGTRRTGKLKTEKYGPTTFGKGSLFVSYMFLVPGRSYMIFYVQTPTGDLSGDYLKEYDLMVQKTLKLTK